MEGAKGNVTFCAGKDVSGSKKAGIQQFNAQNPGITASCSSSPSISAITDRSSAVASCAPSRCTRSVSASVLISIITWPSASSAAPLRARIEKSPSRRAASRLATVCSGRTSCSRASTDNPTHSATTTTTNAART